MPLLRRASSVPCTLAFREQTEDRGQAARGQAAQVPQPLQEKLIQSEQKLATVSLERAWVADTFAPPKPKKEEEDKKRRDEDKTASVISTHPIHLETDTLTPCTKKDNEKKQRMTMLLFAPPNPKKEKEDKKRRDEGNSAVVMSTHPIHLQPGTLKSCVKKDTEKKHEEDKTGTAKKLSSSPPFPPPVVSFAPPVPEGDTSATPEQGTAAANATRQPARNGSSSGTGRLLLLLLLLLLVVAMGASCAAFYFWQLTGCSCDVLDARRPAISSLLAIKMDLNERHVDLGAESALGLCSHIKSAMVK